MTDKTDKTRCAICGSTNLHDWCSGKWGIVICLRCGAKWWGKWRTRQEWDVWVNGDENE